MWYVECSMLGGKIRNFTDLIAWQEGHKLVLLIYEITKRFPREEQFGLTIQLRKAAISVTSNIAEGFRRNSYREKSQFYAIALGSLSEMENQMLIAKDLNYNTQIEFQKISDQIIRTSKLTRGLMKSSRTY